MNFDRNLLVQVQHQFSILAVDFQFFLPFGDLYLELYRIPDTEGPPLDWEQAEGQDRFITLISLHQLAVSVISSVRCESERNFSVRRKESHTLKHSLFLRRLKTED